MRDRQKALPYRSAFSLLQKDALCGEFSQLSIFTVKHLAQRHLDMSYARFWVGTRQWHDAFPVMHFSLTSRFLWQVLLQFGVLRSYSGSWRLFWEPLHECGYVRSGGGPCVPSLHVLHQQTLVRAQFMLLEDNFTAIYVRWSNNKIVPNCKKGFCVKWRNVTQTFSLSVCHTGLEGERACQVFCVCLVLPASVQF